MKSVAKRVGTAVTIMATVARERALAGSICCQNRNPKSNEASIERRNDFNTSAILWTN
jgi:hypothetical protein